MSFAFHLLKPALHQYKVTQGKVTTLHKGPGANICNWPLMQWAPSERGMRIDIGTDSCTKRAKEALPLEKKKKKRTVNNSISLLVTFCEPALHLTWNWLIKEAFSLQAELSIACLLPNIGYSEVSLKTTTQTHRITEFLRLEKIIESNH